MKTSVLHSYVNTIILFAILLLGALSASDLGGPDSKYNSICFLLAVMFFFLNRHIDYSLMSFFAIPLIFLLLSVVVNISTLHPGGFNAALTIIVGYTLLTLKPFSLHQTLMRRLIVLYLITGLVLSINATMENLALTVAVGNAGFNGNPNGASIFFCGCIILSLVFAGSFLRWFLVIAFSLLVITTGSRAGLIDNAMLLVGYLLFSADVPHRTCIRNVLNKSKVLLLLGLVLVPVLAYYLVPDSVDFIVQRFTASGVGISAKGGGGRDEIWESALDVSKQSLTSILIGHGPATATDLIDSGTHSSYVEATTSIGWPFMISTMLALLFLFRYHIRRTQGIFLIYAIPILVHGATETILFSGLGTLWYLLIFLSLYFRSKNSAKVLLKGKYIDPHYGKYVNQHC